MTNEGQSADHTTSDSHINSGDQSAAIGLITDIGQITDSGKITDSSRDVQINKEWPTKGDTGSRETRHYRENYSNSNSNSNSNSGQVVVTATAPVAR
jgi:hypothetical protein